eukprot:1156142-Pelagomonas_calceolata.AAC.5
MRGPGTSGSKESLSQQKTSRLLRMDTNRVEMRADTDRSSDGVLMPDHRGPRSLKGTGFLLTAVSARAVVGPFCACNACARFGGNRLAQGMRPACFPFNAFGCCWRAKGILAVSNEHALIAPKLLKGMYTLSIDAHRQAFHPDISSFYLNCAFEPSGLHADPCAYT